MAPLPWQFEQEVLPKAKTSGRFRCPARFAPAGVSGSAGRALGSEDEDHKSGSKECAHMQVPQLSFPFYSRVAPGDILYAKIVGTS
jgi:hypothetical protein